MLSKIIFINTLPIVLLALIDLYKNKSGGEFPSLILLVTDTSDEDNQSWQVTQKYASKLLLSYGIIFLIINATLISEKQISTIVMLFLQVLAYSFIGYWIDSKLN